MNRKQLGILLMLAFVVGSAGLVLHRNQNASWKTGNAGSGGKLLGGLAVNDVARILIQQGTNDLNLVKRDDAWKVRERNDYPADFSRISGFLLKARDLKAVQSETVGPSQLARLQLAPPGQGTNSALRVEFKGQNDQPIKTLLLGRLHLKQSGRASQFGGGDEGWPDGRYVKTPDSGSVALISDPLTDVEPGPAAWLDKDFIRVEKPMTIGVTFPVATNSWKLTRETESGGWKLADAGSGERLDASRTGGVSNPFSSPSFTDVLPGTTLDGTGTNRPIVVAIDTFDHFNYTIRVGQKTNDDYPVTVAVTAQIAKERTPGKDEKAEDKARFDKEFKDSRQKLEDKLKREQAREQWTYLVQSGSVDPLLKPRSQLLVEKKEEAPPPQKTPAAAGRNRDGETNSPAGEPVSEQ